MDLTNDSTIPLFISNFVTVLLILFFSRDRNQQTAVYKEQIARLESQSLRAQMNPHFIFNALNGIQSVMILQGEAMVNKYLGVFSKMLRFTMDMSNNDLISLKDELIYLTTYIELQNMRMQQDVDFLVKIDEKIDPHQCFLPTMLLQPIVENAIIHGLQPLKKNKKIEIKVKKVKKEKNLLRITVEDNGVGRKASQDRKQKMERKHTSYASQILKERIDIYSYLRREKTDFFMENINSSKKNTGTRAVLVFPYLIEKEKFI